MRRIRRALDWLGDLRAGLRQAANDALMVGRLRERFAHAQLPLSQLTDTELEKALAEGLMAEMRRRMYGGDPVFTLATETVHGTRQYERSMGAEPGP